MQVFDLRMLRQTLPLSFAPAMIAPNLLGTHAKTKKRFAASCLCCRLLVELFVHVQSYPPIHQPTFLHVGYIPGKDRLVVGSGASGQFLMCDPYNAADTEFFHVRVYVCLCVSLYDVRSLNVPTFNLQ